MDAEADELAKRIRKECQEMPDPSQEQPFDRVYVDDHPGLAREREEFFAYQAGFVDSDQTSQEGAR